MRRTYLDHNASTPIAPQVANLLGCKPSEIVFTSGGSESNNFAVKGAFFELREKGKHIITAATEHPRDTSAALRRVHGWQEPSKKTT